MVMVLGGFVRFFDREEQIIRPPGALPEPEFLSVCIRCDRCRQECPYAYISPVALTESLVGFGTPKLQGAEQGFCARCFRCVYVCPTGALRNDR